MKPRLHWNFFPCLFLILLSSNPVWSQNKNPNEVLAQISQQAYSGNYRQAAQLAEQYIKQNPNDPQGYMFRAMVYDWERNLGNQPEDSLLDKTADYHKKANQMAFQIWHRNPEDIQALIDLGNSYIFLGRAYSDQGKKMKAVLTAKKGPKHLEKALEKEPTRLDPLVALGVYHYIADTTPKSFAAFKALLGIKGSRDQGLQELQKAAGGKNIFQNDARVALFYIHYEFEKDYPQALVYLNQLEQKFPENPLWQILKAIIYEKQDPQKGMKGYADAVAWCQAKAGRCSDKFLAEAYFRGGRLAKKSNQPQTAREMLDQALRLTPKHQPRQLAWTLFYLGQLDLASGQSQLALEKFQRAKKIKHISKDQKKRIEKSIDRLCQADPPPAKC